MRGTELRTKLGGDGDPSASHGQPQAGVGGRGPLGRKRRQGDAAVDGRPGTAGGAGDRASPDPHFARLLLSPVGVALFPAAITHLPQQPELPEAAAASARLPEDNPDGEV